MNQKRKGFTLIELLAVIVILAIIALIAVPVIMNIIDKANKSAFKDTAYGIINAGELYFAEMQLEPNGMLADVEITLPDSRLELKGDIPEGSVTITKDGKVSIAVQNGRYCITKGINDTDVTVTEDLENCTMPGGGGNTGVTVKTLSEIVTAGYMRPSTSTSTATSVPDEYISIPSCVAKGQICTAGTPMVIKVNENETYNFYVLSDDGNKVSLLMDRNLGDCVEWDANYTGDGPVTAVAALKDRTSGWTNIAEKEYTYSDYYDEVDYVAFTETMRARMLNKSERSSFGSDVPVWARLNLYTSGNDNHDGYWLPSAYTGYSNLVYGKFLNYTDQANGEGSNFGVRPVIEVSK